MRPFYAMEPLSIPGRRDVAKDPEFLKEQRVLEATEFRIARIVGEKRALAASTSFGGFPRPSRTAWGARSRTRLVA